MKILITGGAGYVGTSVVKELVKHKEVEQVKVFDNLSKGHHNFFMGKQYTDPSKIKFIRGEILDSRLLKKEMKDVDVVIHLAAIVTTPFANTDPHFYEQINHWGTAEVVYAAEESNISKFIYLSSTSVYGITHEEANERTTPSPSTFYGISKLRGEDHVSRLMDSKNAIILRGGNVYGYNRSIRFDAVINRFMFDANFSNRIQIFGTGKQTRAFIHVDQIGKIISNVSLNQVDNGIYNVVDKNLQIMDLLDAFKEIFPELEFIFSNQHMSLRELQVSPESKLFDFIPTPQKTELEAELRAFKDRLAY